MKLLVCRFALFGVLAAFVGTYPSHGSLLTPARVTTKIAFFSLKNRASTYTIPVNAIFLKFLIDCLLTMLFCSRHISPLMIDLRNPERIELSSQETITVLLRKVS